MKRMEATKANVCPKINKYSKVCRSLIACISVVFLCTMYPTAEKISILPYKQ